MDTRTLLASTFIVLVVGVLAAATRSGVSAQALPTAQDLITKSVQAHGGTRLTNWKTISVTGTVDMDDGITYRAAYRLRAILPDRVRVDDDQTADRGRYFYEYFLNGGTAWSRRNLVVGPADVKRLERWLNQCYGIAYYAAKATSLTLLPDAAVEWREPVEKGSSSIKVVDSTPAYVVRAVVGGANVDLFFDKTHYYLIQEIAPEGRRTFRDFKAFSGVTWPTRVAESGRQGTLTMYAYTDVRYNQPIEDWLFEEDRPQAAGAKK